MDKGWIQFLLVGVPVLSLIGSWLALRAVVGRRRPPADGSTAERNAMTKAEDK
jgi:hypothetical protein